MELTLKMDLEELEEVGMVTETLSVDGGGMPTSSSQNCKRAHQFWPSRMEDHDSKSTSQYCLLEHCCTRKTISLVTAQYRQDQG